MSLVKCRFLEVHVAHSCNLSCESCSHYSNFKQTGFTSLEDAELWMNTWSKKVDPSQFSLVGGEPTLHPKLSDFVLLSRKYWPRADLRLVTNGFLLYKHPELPNTLRKTNTKLYLSVHHSSESYQVALTPVLALLDTWTKEYNLKIHTYDSHKLWRKTYQGLGSNILPFEDENAGKSWTACLSKYCLQLHENKLWKCPNIAYLQLHKNKYGLDSKWDSYLDYKPLESKATAEETKSFVASKHEHICSMCPTSKIPLALENPLPKSLLQKPISSVEYN